MNSHSKDQNADTEVIAILKGTVAKYEQKDYEGIGGDLAKIAMKICGDKFIMY